MDSLNLIILEDNEIDYLNLEKYIKSLDSFGTIQYKWIRSNKGFEEILSIINRSYYQLCFVSHKFNDNNGYEFINYSNEKDCNIPMILLLDSKSESINLSKIKSDTDDYLFKDQLNLDVLERSIRYTLSKYRMYSTIKETHLRTETILETIQDTIIVINEFGEIIQSNRIGLSNFNFTPEEVLGEKIKVLIPKLGTAKTENSILDLNITLNKIHELLGVKKDGTPFPIEVSLQKWRWMGNNYFTIVVHDITQRKATEEQLRHAQKMEVIGKLTGGIAHDFNNQLGIIRGNLDYLNIHFKDSPRISEKINKAQDSVTRGAELTKKLLGFAHKQQLNPVPIQVNDLIQDLLSVLKRTVDKNINIETRLINNLNLTVIDKGQLENAILNLLINARDAMPGGGDFIISTKNIYLDENYNRMFQNFVPGEYVEISFNDNGIGMSNEMRQKIFEPFFTTKPLGQGTGMGLAMVHGFVSQSNGYICVNSKLNRGTTFHIYLPKYQGTQKPLRITREPVFECFLTGTETILAVDDESEMLEVTTMYLSQLGYNIIKANNAIEALDMVEKNPDKIQMVLSDIIMPGEIDGRRLAKKINNKNKKLKIGFVSGFSANFNKAGEKIELGYPLLNKPFTKSELSKFVRRTLDVNNQ